jgi:two-component system, sensor histidine kinase
MPFRKLAPTDNSIDLDVQVGGLIARTQDVAARTPESGPHARELLVSVLGSITEGLFVLDKDWRYTYCNEQGARISGTRPEKLLGCCVWDLFPEARASKFHECSHRAVDSGEAVHFEEYYPAPSNRWFECHCCPFEESLYVFFRDVTERRRAEEDVRQLLVAARAEKESLSLVLNSITDEVWFTNTQKCCTLANAAALREFGCTSVEGLTVEKAHENLVVLRADGSRRPLEEAPSLRALAGEAVRNEEQIVLTPRTGELRHRQVSSTPVRDVGGSIIGAVSVVSDITGRKRAEQALRASRLKLEAALASMTDAVFISDDRRRFVDFNDAFATFHRFKNRYECPQTLAEYPALLDVFMRDGSSVPLDMWAVPRALRGDIGTNIEYVIRRKDTGESWLGSYSFAPIRDDAGAIVGSVVSARDITERTRAEEAIRAREALEQARDSAVRANEGKSRFLAAASHDLRQPLQAIELLNGTLRRLVTDQNAIEVLSQQDLAIDTMSRLLNALLDISKLESGAIKPAPINCTLAEIFEVLRSEFARIAADKGLVLEVEMTDDVVHTDPALLEQILRNLVSNAVRYSSEGRVRLRSLREAALVRIEVIDTGVGIPADELAYIYDEFYQVGVSANSTRDGYGLGLSIVQRLVKLLSLKLDVRSEVGRGSTFSLVLPAADADRSVKRHRRAIVSTASESRQADESRVLLVEDNSSVRRAMCRLLGLEGYRVTPVVSLAEALQHVEAGNAVDLLICDYHLSGGETGTQVIAALRKILGISLRALLITGDTSSAIKQLPRDPYLRFTSKPIKVEELLALLRALLAA